MSERSGQSPAERFLAATELADIGIAIQRQNLCRKHPDATEVEIDDLLRSWMQDRPLDYSPTRQVAS
jgi:hypothetical protein